MSFLKSIMTVLVVLTLVTVANAQPCNPAFRPVVTIHGYSGWCLNGNLGTAYVQYSCAACTLPGQTALERARVHLQQAVLTYIPSGNPLIPPMPVITWHTIGTTPWFNKTVPPMWPGGMLWGNIIKPDGYPGPQAFIRYKVETCCWLNAQGQPQWPKTTTGQVVHTWCGNVPEPNPADPPTN